MCFIYNKSRITLLHPAKLLSLVLGYIFLFMWHTEDRGTDHSDDKIDIVLLTAELLPFIASL